MALPEPDVGTTRFMLGELLHIVATEGFKRGNFRRVARGGILIEVGVDTTQ
jgi:hypothetical protein